MGNVIYRPFESGRLAKPDRLDAGIAHIIGAYFLEQEPRARFNVRVNGKWDTEQNRPEIDISGEVSAYLLDDPHIHEHLDNRIIAFYNEHHLTDYGPDYFRIIYTLNRQTEKLQDNHNAGDSGTPMVAAVNYSPLSLPPERYMAVEVRKLIDGIYRREGEVPATIASATGIDEVKGLGADGKIQAIAKFDDEQLAGIRDIVVSVQQEPSLPLDRLRRDLTRIIKYRIKELSDYFSGYGGNKTSIIINPLGEWYEGGWKVDQGNSEAKPQEDYFGNRGLMEDAFWGEDWRKPSGAGHLQAWKVAKTIIEQGLADVAYVGLEYTIGQPDAQVFNINLNGTGKMSQQEVIRWVEDNIDLNLKNLAKRYRLDDPTTYQKVAEHRDLFHHPGFPWNRSRRINYEEQDA
ncbi:MAG: methionine adenosyltransferase domain-containing protein [DPANN group archaeon]|nr:methionine adenosyltransferase domain-containing protein [DPANN group archaeon]